jgi:hypothetical protein
MPIAPNGRIARTSDGMEDMNAFFAADPASVPPLQRAKRISQILEEQEGAHPAEEEEDDDDDEDDEDDEDEDEYDEEEDGQTANYGGRGRTSNATSSRRAEESEEEEDEYDEEHTGGYEQGGSQDIDEEDDASRYNTTVASSVHRGRRQSRAQTNADIYNDDDGGTQTMSLEGSKFHFAHSPVAKQHAYSHVHSLLASSPLLSTGSFFNKTTRTIDTIPAPTAKKSRLSTRSDIYDDPPSSPPEQGQQSSSPARSSRQARNAVASTSKQRTQAMNGGSTSDEGENEAVQSSLTRSAQARRRRSNEGRNRGEVSTSPVYDRKGKGRQSLFAAPSSDTNGNSRVEGNEDDDDGYGDEEQGGFEPAGEDGQDGYDNYAAVDGDDYPNGDDNDETGYELPQRRDDDGSEDEAAGGEEDEDDVRSDDDQVHLSDEEDQHIGNPDEQYESDHSVELPPPLSAKNSKAAKNVKPAKAQRKAAANDSGHVDEDKTTHTTPRAKPKPKAAAAAAKQQLKKKQKRVYENPDGLRRSHRDRTSPVAFWRNEHIIYQRKDSPSGVAYYEKVGVADRPKPPVRSLVNRQKRSRSVSQAASNKRAKTRSVSVGTDAAGEDAGPQQGMQQDWSKWDEETDPDGIVWDYVDGKETQRRTFTFTAECFCPQYRTDHIRLTIAGIVFTSTMLDPKSTRHGYKFQRIFTDGEFMGGGVLIIPPGEKKPLKPAKDNTYVGLTQCFDAQCPLRQSG